MPLASISAPLRASMPAAAAPSGTVMVAVAVIGFFFLW
jgi:hypothetical protein